MWSPAPTEEACAWCRTRGQDRRVSAERTCGQVNAGGVAPVGGASCHCEVLNERVPPGACLVSRHPGRIGARLAGAPVTLPVAAHPMGAMCGLTGGVSVGQVVPPQYNMPLNWENATVDCVCAGQSVAVMIHLSSGPYRWYNMDDRLMATHTFGGVPWKSSPQHQVPTCHHRYCHPPLFRYVRFPLCHMSCSYR